jgi:hypothetical protein
MLFVDAVGKHVSFEAAAFPPGAVTSSKGRPRSSGRLLIYGAWVEAVLLVLGENLVGVLGSQFSVGDGWGWVAGIYSSVSGRTAPRIFVLIYWNHGIRKKIPANLWV